MSLFGRIFGGSEGRKDATPPAAPPRGRGIVVEVEDAVLRIMPPGREPVLIEWPRILRVEIATTPPNPFDDDVFWILTTREREYWIPQQSEGEPELAAVLMELPGFSHARAAAAMTSTGQALFPVWERKVPLGTPDPPASGQTAPEWLDDVEEELGVRYPIWFRQRWSELEQRVMLQPGVTLLRTAADVRRARTGLPITFLPFLSVPAEGRERHLFGFDRWNLGEARVWNGTAYVALLNEDGFFAYFDRHFPPRA